MIDEQAQSTISENRGSTPVLPKMINEIAQEATGYYKRRKQAIYKRKRRPAPLDLGGIAASMPTPLISFGDKAK